MELGFWGGALLNTNSTANSLGVGGKDLLKWTCLLCFMFLVNSCRGDWHWWGDKAAYLVSVWSWCSWCGGHGCSCWRLSHPQQIPQQIPPRGGTNLHTFYQYLCTTSSWLQGTQSRAYSAGFYTRFSLEGEIIAHGNLGGLRACSPGNNLWGCFWWLLRPHTHCLLLW